MGSNNYLYSIYINITLKLHSYYIYIYIYITFTQHLNLHYNATTSALHYICITLIQHLYGIHIYITLHLHYTYATFTLYVYYIHITSTLHYTLPIIINSNKSSCIHCPGCQSLDYSVAPKSMPIINKSHKLWKNRKITKMTKLPGAYLYAIISYKTKTIHWLTVRGRFCWARVPPKTGRLPPRGMPATSWDHPGL